MNHKIKTQDQDYSPYDSYRLKPISKKQGSCKVKIQEFKIQQSQYKFKKKRGGRNLTKGKGKWTLKQISQYIQFLKKNKNLIVNGRCRKQMKIFKQMSLFLTTRTPDQCRSHHQKVQKLHKKIDDIIKVYSQRVMLGIHKKFQTQQQKIQFVNQIKQSTMLIDTVDYYDLKIQQNKLEITIKANNIALY